MTASARPAPDGARQEPAGPRTAFDTTFSRTGEAQSATPADPPGPKAPVSTPDRNAAASPSRLHRYAIQGLPGKH